MENPLPPEIWYMIDKFVTESYACDHKNNFKLVLAEMADQFPRVVYSAEVIPELSSVLARM